MKLLRISFITLLTLMFLKLFQGEFLVTAFQWLFFIFIADLTLARLKVLEDRKAERILVRYNSLNVEPTYGGET